MTSALRPNLGHLLRRSCDLKAAVRPIPRVWQLRAPLTNFRVIAELGRTCRKSSRIRRAACARELGLRYNHQILALGKSFALKLV